MVATGAAVAMVAKDVFIHVYIFNIECGCDRRSRRNGRERRLYTRVYLIQRVVATGAMVAKDAFIHVYI